MDVKMVDSLAWVQADGIVHVTFPDGKVTRVGGQGAAILTDIITGHDPIAAEAKRTGSTAQEVGPRVTAFVDSLVEMGVIEKQTSSLSVEPPQAQPRKRRRHRRSESFHVLFVCTANICRSAYAHALLEAENIDGVRVSSAGTHALVGRGIDFTMADELPEGVDGSGHVAQQLTEEIAESADLIVAMSERHRTYIIDEWPHLASATFLIGQVGRGIGGLTQRSQIASQLWQGRTVLPSDSVRDPYQRGQDAARTAADHIREHVDALAQALRTMER